MAKARAKKSSFNIKEMDLKEAQRVFNQKRGRVSKYDEILNRAGKLDKGKALIVEGLTNSEITGLRKRITDILGGGWAASSTKVDSEKNLFDVLIHRAK